VPPTAPATLHPSGPGCSGKAFTRVKLHVLSAAVVALATPAVSVADNHVLALNSVGQYLRVPHSTTLSASSALTVEYWVRVNNTSGFGRIGKTAPSDGQWGLEVASWGTTVMTIHGTGVTDIVAHPLNEWFHIAGTWNRASGLARVYVNGELRNTTSGLVGPMKSTTYPIFIGFQPNFSDSQMYGAVDNFRVWTVERSQEEIRGLMYEQLSVSDATGLSGLVLSLSFESGGTDASPASNHGILEGGASIVVDNSFGLNPDCNNDGIADAQQIARGELADYNSNLVPDCCESGTPCQLGNYPVQWRVEDGGNGHWYALGVESGLAWDQARARAVSLGGELASVHGVAENLFVFRLGLAAWTGGWSGPWLGGYRDGYVWRWSDGTAWSFAEWDCANPSNQDGIEDRLHFGINPSCPYWPNASPKWNDVVASADLGGYVIEWSADCNGDGIVDYGQIVNGQLEDTNSNGVPDSCDPAPCPGDVTGDGVVDGVDLATVLGAWGAAGLDIAADVNGDGLVEGKDLAFVLSAWGPCVVVPAWATLVEAYPDPSVVHNPSLRASISATGIAWRVRDTATQIEMVLIPPGTYSMGCSPSLQHGCNSDESPIHPVTLTQPFYMGRYEVTQAQWQARTGTNPSTFQSPSPQVPAEQVPNRPVERVSWDSIQGFLSATDMRLPTEAEWEFACRAGTTTAFHSRPGDPNGTNDYSLLGHVAWSGDNSLGQTRPVGQLAGNGFGLHDMSGNVWEWVNDWYSESYYASSPLVNPPGPNAGSHRVWRGGGWNDSTDSFRSSVRYNSGFASTGFGNYGFRVVRDP
jgi:formylglycine-generating enzyme required for sulfatase activity